MGIVLLGSVAGQGLIVGATPLLTRLYDPAAFGLLSVTMAISAVLATAMIMRLDAAVTLPRSRRGAAAIAYLAAAISMAVAVVIALLGIGVASPLASAVNVPSLQRYWWLLVAATLALAFDQMMLSWLVRDGRYRSIAWRNFIVGAGQVGCQLALGVAHIGPVGLLVGLVVGRLLGLGGLVGKGGLFRQRPPSVRLVRAASCVYRRYIYVGIWSSLINTVGTQLPLLVIGAFYGDRVVGLLGLTFRVLAAPAGLIGMAVARVFQAESSAIIRRVDSSSLAATVVKNTRSLAALGAPFALLLALCGPWLFQLLFGSEWYQAGEYARYLAFGYLAQLAVAPVSNTLILLDRQGQQLTWDISRMVLTIGAPCLCAALGATPLVAVMSLSASYLVSYVALWLTIVRRAKLYDNGRFEPGRSGLTVTTRSG